MMAHLGREGITLRWGYLYYFVSPSWSEHRARQLYLALHYKIMKVEVSMARREINGDFSIYHISSDTLWSGRRQNKFRAVAAALRHLLVSTIGAARVKCRRAKPIVLMTGEINHGRHQCLCPLSAKLFEHRHPARGILWNPSPSLWNSSVESRYI